MLEMRKVRHRVRGRDYDFKVISHPGAAAVLPVQDGQVLLVKQFRPAVARKMLEVPAGVLEPGEDPLECAKRELEEETGFRARTVTSLGEFWPAPGYSEEVLHLFLAQNLEPGQQDLDESEDIEVKWVPLTKVYEMIDRGELVDGKTVVSVLKYRMQANAS